MKAAAVATANEGVGAGSEGSDGDEVLHHDCSSANVEGLVITNEQNECSFEEINSKIFECDIDHDSYSRN